MIIDNLSITATPTKITLLEAVIKSIIFKYYLDYG